MEDSPKKRSFKQTIKNTRTDNSSGNGRSRGSGSSLGNGSPASGSRFRKDGRPARTRKYTDSDDNGNSGKRSYTSRGDNSSSGSGFRRDDRPERGRYTSRGDDRNSERRPYSSRGDNSSSGSGFRKEDRPERSRYADRGDDRNSERRPYSFRRDDASSGSGDRKAGRPAGRRKYGNDRDGKPFKKGPYTSRNTRQDDRRDDRYRDRDNRRQYDSSEERPRRSFSGSSDKPSYKNDRYKDETPRKRKRDVTAESAILTEIVERRHREGRKAPQKQKILSLEYEEQYGPIRLNKYISNAGICSRRDADTLIESGAITVNGKVVTELGTKVMPTDEVRFGDKVLQREKPVYLLLNKPKDYITTMYDDRDRKDVMELVRGACKERVYPVGRLDKNTTGLLLFTNDGEMAKKLTHPKHNIRKIYYLELNKNLSGSDFEAILNGIELEDGFIKPDDLAYVNDSKREIGITIHSGRNRIVRRIFEKLDYNVIKLDRVAFAGLTKKNLPRGKWRFLTDAEINILKMI